MPSKLIGRNVTGVQGDAADLDDLDRLFDTVKREKGAVDVLWASAGMGEQRQLGEITEEHFDTAFGLNARGTLFTVQKALPLFNDGGSILMTGSNASLSGFPGWSVYAASKAVQQAYARVWLAELKDRRIRVNVLTPGQVATAKQQEVFDEATKRQFEALIPRGRDGQPRRDRLRRALPRLRRLELRERHGAGRRRRNHGDLRIRTGRSHEQHQHQHQRTWSAP